MSSFSGVWVFSENLELAAEMLSKGRELADKLQMELAAIVLGYNIKEQAEALAAYSADRILTADNPIFKSLQVEPYLGALADLAVKHKPEIILIGSTRRGRELAARLAARLQTGLIPDVLKLEINEEKMLTATRIVYGGRGVATQTYRTKPQIATIPPRTFEKPKPSDRKAEVVDVEVKVEELKAQIVEIKPLETAKTRIEEAKVIVCGGRGVSKKEDFKMLEELANLLGGQVGGTRPLAEDRKWFSEWVGLSGKKVKPEIYIGCGISGMIQHIAGIRDSRVIVAINKDPNAAIFEVADYAVVGDIYQIIPALIETLKQTLKQ
ncbi:MAG: electron transfer flavoprotein subunit alpha/FixB family protein [Candidatus Bathyarchaeia archaeon]